MADLQAVNMGFQKVPALPAVGDRLPNTMYFVQALNGLMEVHMTGLSASDVRHTPVEAEIKQWINSALAGFNNVLVAANLAARDAMVSGFTQNMLVMVIDTTGNTDDIENNGAAMYMFDYTAQTWAKIYEAESLDVKLDWNNLLNRPVSSVAAIDDAVAKRHSHANAAVLDVLTRDSEGNLLVEGAYIAPRMLAGW